MGAWTPYTYDMEGVGNRRYGGWVVWMDRGNGCIKWTSTGRWIWVGLGDIAYFFKWKVGTKGERQGLEMDGIIPFMSYVSNIGSMFLV